MTHDPFGYIPEEDCTYILWWANGGELCWTNLGGNPIVDTYGTKVSAEMIFVFH